MEISKDKRIKSLLDNGYGFAILSDEIGMATVIAGTDKMKRQKITQEIAQSICLILKFADKVQKENMVSIMQDFIFLVASASLVNSDCYRLFKECYKNVVDGRNDLIQKDLGIDLRNLANE